ncbi:MAG: hypothetical protein FD135_3481 [Comamonadaceae bacterium]|nr:MAG: hypothetical protein FD135_3481 [Comamonadaceae bacterium]
MKSAAPTSLLSPEHIAMVDKGVSAIVSSCDVQLRPSIMRAMGSSITPDGGSITVYLSRRQSRQLLLDVAATGRIAVVFSEPLSHQTVQVKARQARIRPAQASDEPQLQRYRAAMAHEVAKVGFEARFAYTMFDWQLDDLVAISFEPQEAYDQTPGPRAGVALSASGATP